MNNIPLIIKNLGLRDYADVFKNMHQLTTTRDADTLDELWFLEHHPVYTQGLAGKPEHILKHNHIPIIKTDRGGQITYHGPGQLIIYPLLNIKRLGVSPIALVDLLELTTIQTLKKFHITAYSDPKARGIYVDTMKIASIGLKIKNKCAYHGLAINIDMDLSPFESINPCGYADLKMTSVNHFQTVSLENFQDQWLNYLLANTRYHRYNCCDDTPNH